METVNWSELDGMRHLDPEKYWIGNMLLAALTEIEVFDDKKFMASLKVDALQVELTINGRPCRIFPFFTRCYKHLDELAAEKAEDMWKKRLGDILDAFDEVRKILERRFPEIQRDEEDE